MDEIIKIIKIFQEEYGFTPPPDCIKNNIYHQVIFSLGKITLRVTDFNSSNKNNKNSEWRLIKYEGYIAMEKWKEGYLCSIEIDDI
jgi:hypothetical protein